MAKDNKTFIETSKIAWRNGEGKFETEDYAIVKGCLQRIAGSLESIDQTLIRISWQPDRNESKIKSLEKKLKNARKKARELNKVSE